MPEVNTPSRQAQTVAIPKRWPLVDVLTTRSSQSPPTKDARLINCFAERNADESYSIFKRPGLSPYFNIGSAAISRGIYTSARTGIVYSVFGDMLYAGGVGALIDPADPIRFCSFEIINTAAVLPTIVLQDQANMYGIVDGSAASTRFIIHTGLPRSMVYGLVQLDGALYVMDYLGYIYESDQNDPTTWNLLNVIQANNNSDLAVCLAKQLSYILAFKQGSVEVFYDAGNTVGSSLARIPEAEIAYGCLFGQTVQSIDNLVLYVTSNQSASSQVILIENLAPKVISTPGVERLLDNIAISATLATSLSGLQAWTFKHGGHRFYGLTCAFLNITLVYDIDQKLWYLWSDLNGNYWPYTGLAYKPQSAGVSGMLLIQHESNGNIYQLDGSYTFPTDYGNVFAVDIFTPNFDAGTARAKQLNMLYVQADQQSGSVLQASYSDDDYQTFSDPRDIDLSVERPSLNNEGSFYKRAYHFHHQLPTPLRIKSVDLQLDVGTL